MLSLHCVVPCWQVDMFKAIRASATPQVMLDSSRAIFTGPVTRLVLTTPEPVPGGDKALLAALARPATIKDDRLAAVKADFDQLPKIGDPGPLVSQTAIPGLRAERIEFANGVTALISNNQGEPGTDIGRAHGITPVTNA